MKRCVLALALLVLIGVPGVKGGQSMQLTSSEFKNGMDIPDRFTCQGSDVSPALSIAGTPEAAQSLVLIVDDPDAPVGEWVHWVVFNIDPLTQTIPEGAVPGIQGWNDFGRMDWGGPCPPRGTHRYFFKVYALDTELALKPGAKKTDVLAAIQGHILDQAELMGRYKQF